MGHKFAEGLVSRAQSVVTFFRASHKTLGHVEGPCCYQLQY